MVQAIGAMRKVANFGELDVREHQKLVARFHRFYEPVTESGCWLWLGTVDRLGYGKISCRRARLKAHRVAYELLVGEIPPDMHVCHHCDVRSCVNPAHLFLGLPKDNALDRDRKGRRRGGEGERHGHAKLTAAQAIAIFHSTLDRSVLSCIYAVSISAIRSIQTGDNWSKVTGARPT